MAWWLDFGFCGQLWLSPQSYYPSSRIRSAKETVVYSIASEQTKDTVVPLRQRPTQCIMTKLQLHGVLQKLHTADDKSVDWRSSYGTLSAYADNNIAAVPQLALHLHHFQRNK